MAHEPRIRPVAALQYFGPLENTFASFTGSRTNPGLALEKMNMAVAKIIAVP